MAKKEADGAALAAKVSAILGAIFAIAAYAVFDLKTAWSTAAGAAIAVANILALRAIVRSMIRAPEPETTEGQEKEEQKDEKRDHKAEGRRGGLAWGVFAVFKILLLFGGIWILLTFDLVDPMALAFGYGVLPLGIVISSFRASLSPNR